MLQISYGSPQKHVFPLMLRIFLSVKKYFNPLNAELNPICHLLALLGGATIVVVSRLRVKLHLQLNQQGTNVSVLEVCGT